MKSSICALGGMHQKNFEMRNFKKILLKIENVEKMHQNIGLFFYISKKNEIIFTLHYTNSYLSASRSYFLPSVNHL